MGTVLYMNKSIYSNTTYSSLAALLAVLTVILLTTMLITSVYIGSISSLSSSLVV